MKDEYDFSNAEQRFVYVPVEQIELPIYLDKDLVLCLEKKCQASHKSTIGWTEVRSPSIANDALPSSAL
ncbi:hypothetical protein BCS42_06985 [Crenothrix sp. D3]|nr:hypothetical protein BCS42_06985 [Crenothrix sp. D3]